MKFTDYEKNRIESQCQPLIEKLKSQYVSKNPDKKYNYLVDIYVKWYRDYLYFCEKYKSDEMEWMEIFETKKAEAQILKAEIDKTDKEIDQMIYELYGLSDEEIIIVENN